VRVTNRILMRCNITGNNNTRCSHACRWRRLCAALLYVRRIFFFLSFRPRLCLIGPVSRSVYDHKISYSSRGRERSHDVIAHRSTLAVNIDINDACSLPRSPAYTSSQGQNTFLSRSRRRARSRLCSAQSRKKTPRTGLARSKPYEYNH